MKERKESGVIARSSDFFGNFSNTPLSKSVIIAELLKEKGLPVDIRDDAKNNYGISNPNSLAEYIKDYSVRDMYYRLVSTPEGKVMGRLGDSISLTFDGCNWDNITKRRLEALHWHLRAGKLSLIVEAELRLPKKLRHCSTERNRMKKKAENC